MSAAMKLLRKNDFSSSMSDFVLYYYYGIVFRVSDVTTKGTEAQPQSSWKGSSHHLVPSNQGKQVLDQSDSITSVYQRKQRL